jgi:hypothetical protein
MWIFDKDIAKKIEIRNKNNRRCPFENSKTNVQKYRWTRKWDHFLSKSFMKRKRVQFFAMLYYICVTVHLPNNFTIRSNKICIVLIHTLNRTNFVLSVQSNSIIKLITLRRTLNISPRNGIGAGPGIPRRRNILFVRRL